MKKLVSILMWVTAIIAGYLFCYGLVDAKTVEEGKRERVQTLYDYGLKYYDKGSKYQGCYLLRQAVKEARHLTDNLETYNQIYPIYEATCKSTDH